MSVREARLCDYPDCNGPSTLTCPFCSRDCCKTHQSNRYLTVGVVLGDSPNNNSCSFLGKTGALGMCGQCSEGLFRKSTGLSAANPEDMPLSSVVASTHDALLESAGALLAAEKLKSGV